MKERQRGGLVGPRRCAIRTVPQAENHALKQKSCVRQCLTQELCFYNMVLRLRLVVVIRMPRDDPPPPRCSLAKRGADVSFILVGAAPKRLRASGCTLRMFFATTPPVRCGLAPPLLARAKVNRGACSLRSNYSCVHTFCDAISHFARCSARLQYFCLRYLYVV